MAATVLLERDAGILTSNVLKCHVLAPVRQDNLRVARQATKKSPFSAEPSNPEHDSTALETTIPTTVTMVALASTPSSKDNTTENDAVTVTRSRHVVISHWVGNPNQHDIDTTQKLEHNIPGAPNVMNATIVPDVHLNQRGEQGFPRGGGHGGLSRRGHGRAQRRRNPVKAKQKAREEQEEVARKFRAEQEKAEQKVKEEQEEAAQKIRVEQAEAEQRAKEEEQEAALKAREEQEEAARKAKEERKEVAQKAKEERMEAAQKAKEDLVTCGAGIDIRGVIGSFDLCRILVKRLLRNAKPDEVVGIFSQQGMDPKDFFLLEMKPNGGHTEATVLARAEQGEVITLALDGIKFRDERLRFEVSVNASLDSMGSSGDNCKTLTITWKVPTTSIIATYTSIGLARVMAKALDGQICNRCKVRAVMDQPSRGLRHNLAASIELMNLLPNVPLADVEKFSGTCTLQVVSSLTYDPQEFTAFLRNYLENCPGVVSQSFISMPSLSNKRDDTLRVKVWFHTWEAAKSVSDTLDKTKLRHDYPFLETLLPKALQYVINIPCMQYDSQSKLWNSLMEGRENGKAGLHKKSGSWKVPIVRPTVPLSGRPFVRPFGAPLCLNTTLCCFDHLHTYVFHGFDMCFNHCDGSRGQLHHFCQALTVQAAARSFLTMPSQSHPS
ncbi:uncharacterized protein LACBIDRAFT_321498 [Laccaria bicolor S238N-H82]|uniref:Predicted protein n=1 Tax=Laccaria bicolor (strain S238N-H82 / ATCC MYA-4686) TaxID=486041 RepID=B0CT35_LACBS|nr:uncharacterized protein LACBIDRAFT_321498 [Laccaria bicolor S238N-H82]EDR13869.1 predicted protein [Laccaria bicolor S238N-H82]|eukprot:XP_001874428.1 predicted protein [Laccaria bicolor S238N-H82]